ncbi:MAG TPA: immunoglobulin domain-containing protein, partial [Verrucomicrobiae bacterium]|nr:immunoglobulin domain-containing protein [Verrucomicrobiae bacterium]
TATYRVVVTNSGNIAPGATRTFSVLVLNPPVITTQPLSQTVSPGDDVTFSAVAGGSPPVRYQWYFQNNPVDGGTNATLELLDVQPANGGSYHVVAMNLVGSATSQPALLTVLSAPVLSNPLWLGAGQFQFQLQGGANRTYAIEVSTNLAGWSPLTNVLHTGGTMTVNDPTAPGNTNRFDRARLVQ